MQVRTPSAADDAHVPADPNVDAIPWIAEGIGAGLVGAAVVALFFALVDVAEARLFWTPFTLGSALLLGALPAPGAAISPVLVAAYTAIHGAVFVSIGMIASFQLFSGSPPPGPIATRGLLLAALFFLALELVFVVFGRLFEPGSIALLGYGRVALANMLAAAAMAGLLCARAERRGAMPKR